MTNKQFRICAKINRKWSLKRICKKYKLKDHLALQSAINPLCLDLSSPLDDDNRVFLDNRSQAEFEEARRDRFFRRIPVMLSVLSAIASIVSALIALGALQISSADVLGHTLSFKEIIGLFPH